MAETWSTNERGIAHSSTLDDSLVVFVPPFAVLRIREIDQLGRIPNKRERFANYLAASGYDAIILTAYVSVVKQILDHYF